MPYEIFSCCGQVIFPNFVRSNYFRCPYLSDSLRKQTNSILQKDLKIKIRLHMTCFYKTYSRVLVALLLIVFSLPVTAATFPVTSNADSGPGTLREAINLANGTAGVDDIDFALPASTTISLLTGLPVIIEGVNINGYTQLGAASGPIGTRVIVVEINGAGMPGGADMLVIATSNVTISGLAIYSCPDYAITIGTNLSNVHIWGNYLGTDVTGTTPGIGNQGGVIVNFGNFFPNVATNITVGTNGDGVADADEGNLIVSNTGTVVNGWGIVFWLTQGSTIAGNIIGLDKDGNVNGMGNAQDGILLTVSATGNVIGTDGNGTSDDLEGNQVCSNTGFGILVAASDNNIIAGNRIGLDALDNTAGNGLHGIGILNSSGCRIGTDANSVSDNFEVNVVSANLSGGIGIVSYDFFTDANSNNNVVAGNIIGSDATGALALGNGRSGIFLDAGFGGFSVSNNIIGSNYDGINDNIEGNMIANNDTGINIMPPVPTATSTGNKIARNSIYGNSQLGIDLGSDGVSINDDGDGDAGSNDVFNAPVIITTQVSAGNLILTGFTRPGSVIEFYVSDGDISPNPLPGGFTKSFGEGRTFLFRGQDDATLDAADADLTTGTYDGTGEGTGTGGTRTENRFSFTIPIASLPVAVTSGTRITALAYANATGTGSTSEFSGTVNTSALPVTFTSFKGRVDGDKAELTWTTAEEINNSHFEIERSATGQGYAKIGSVRGNGAGSYQFTDNGPLGAVNYYRLKQVDIDGQATYTRALVLRKDLGEITAKAAPSPFTSFINLSYKLQKAENLRIRLIDQAGRVVKTYNTRGGTGVNTINLNGLDNLPKGSYTVELTGETVSFRQQVLKF
jgi:parallel beta-helix repeat protein